MFELCAPALIYLFFSITQIIIDLYLGLYNTAVIKTIIMIMVTLLLNILCDQNLGVISWMIVFIPFIFLTVIVSIVLYIFGLNVATGTIQKQTHTQKYVPDEKMIQPEELILEKPCPKHGLSKFIHLPLITPPTTQTTSKSETVVTQVSCPVPSSKVKPIKQSYRYPPSGSSSPEYESFVTY
jgi:hypothetical protein